MPTSRRRLLFKGLAITKKGSRGVQHAAMTANAEQAVAALHAAGDDMEALAEALQRAAFLETMPGDSRQKLRGAFLQLHSCIRMDASTLSRLSAVSAATRCSGRHSLRRLAI